VVVDSCACGGMNTVGSCSHKSQQAGWRVAARVCCCAGQACAALLAATPSVLHGVIGAAGYVRVCSIAVAQPLFLRVVRASCG
jgi:hypothetical protein